MDRNFIADFEEYFFDVLDTIAKIPELDIELLSEKKTVLVLMNMTVGMIRENWNINKPFNGVVEPVIELLTLCKKREMPVIAIADAHSENSTEFRYIPKHCIAHTQSAEIIDEIKEVGGYEIIFKNSINAFHSDGFQKFLKENNDIINYIVCGVATDISIMNFCLTLKSYFDEQNRNVNIIVPYNAVETFDQRMHSNDIANVFAIQHMASQGIEFVKGVY